MAALAKINTENGTAYLVVDQIIYLEQTSDTVKIVMRDEHVFYTTKSSIEDVIVGLFDMQTYNTVERRRALS